eukprot:TRINITY_DN41746_c0_g1_i1.p1 TRINITY_DN41746_c0_g1~~TRINITY_DN41746_c0_g1_i1.p1  ORF type:complete len:265 (+),score=39.97 TRINITY_DN41746_c0_g1_i1:92-886(+)
MSTIGQLFLDGLIFSSDCCTCGTFVSVLLQLKRTRSAAGLSMQTIVAVVSARTIHLVSHGISLHYVPAIMPSLVFTCMDVVNACAGITALVVFVTQYYSSYEKAKDNFGIHLFQKLQLLPKSGPFREGPLAASLFLYSVVTVMAFGWYLVRKSQHSFLTSYFCCFYEVLSAVALFPQLWMFNQDKRVSPLLANFVVLTAVNRLCTLAFWVCYPKVYIWRYPDNRGIQMASECLNLLILSDFLFYWVRSKVRGDTEIIIGDGNVV